MRNQTKELLNIIKGKIKKAVEKKNKEMDNHLRNHDSQDTCGELSGVIRGLEITLAIIEKVERSKKAT